MLREPFAKWLWDWRRSLIGWAAAIAGVGAMYSAFWPMIDNPDIRTLLESYPKSLLEALNYTDIATPAGYLNATVYGLVVAMLICVFAISNGSKTIAGDEEAGTLELIAAHPVSRVDLALRRYAAFAVAVVGIVLALFLGILAISGPARLTTVPIANFAAQSLHLALFAMLFGAVSFAAGASTGKKPFAVGAGAALAVFGFAANGILPQVDGMGWTKDVSPFNWLNGGTPLENGVQIGPVLLMAALIVVLVSGGVWRFSRRDVGV
jgi:ABC-2 type transport system permease protein